MATGCSPPPAFFFFFNDTATTEIYTLSLHDALPICRFYQHSPITLARSVSRRGMLTRSSTIWSSRTRSEEHTSELQSLRHLVCRLLLEKKMIGEAAALLVEAVLDVADGVVDRALGDV